MANVGCYDQQIATLVDMGFEPERAASALAEVRGDVAAALAFMLAQDSGNELAARPSPAKRQRSNRVFGDGLSSSSNQMHVHSGSIDRAGSASSSSQSQGVSASTPIQMNVHSGSPGRAVAAVSASSSSQSHVLSASTPIQMHVHSGSPGRAVAASSSSQSHRTAQVSGQVGSPTQAPSKRTSGRASCKRKGTSERQEALSYVLETEPSLEEEDLVELVRFDIVLRKPDFLRASVAEWCKPRKEKLPTGRGKQEVTKPKPKQQGFVEGSGESAELEATFGVPANEFYDAISNASVALSQWLPLKIREASSESTDSRIKIVDFKHCLEAAAKINGVQLSKNISMGTVNMHKNNFNGSSPLLDGRARFLNASPDEWRWVSRPRWACKHPECQLQNRWFYNSPDAARSGGLPKDHQRFFGHAADFVEFAFDHSVKLPMRLAYKHERNWGNTGSMAQIVFSASLPSLVALADFVAYWPPTKEEAYWRLCRRPVTEAPDVEPVSWKKTGGKASIEKKSKDTPMALGINATESSSPGGTEFNIPSCQNFRPAVQPSLLEVPLMEEQLLVLSWMLQREGLQGDPRDLTFMSTHVIERRVAQSDLCLQLRLEREYSNSRGGVLAHQMGFGKTALIIGLVAMTLPPKGEASASHQSPSKAGTLIITPGSSALHCQWQQEFAKFMGSNFKSLTVLAISTLEDLQMHTLVDIYKADVVVVNGDFFLAASYRNAFDKVFGAVKSEVGYDAVRYAKMRKKVEEEGGSLTGSSRATRHPFFEEIHWHRVVFDEFHKMIDESTSGLAAWRAFHEVQATVRWGLTGTPTLNSALAVSEMAGMLHVFVPPDSRQQAQNFLEVWVRTDVWDVSAISVRTHNVLVKPTAYERSLYVGWKRMLEAQGLHGEDAARTQLLKLCSHFSPEDLESVSSCDAAVLEAIKEQRVALKLQTEKAANANAVVKRGNFERPADRRRAEEIASNESQRLDRVSAALSYFESITALLQRVQRGEEKAQECPICLVDFDRSDELSVTRCGHIFCSSCLESTVAITSGCPTCRKRLTSADYDLISGLRFSGGADQIQTCRYGTKIGQIVSQLHEIQEENERGQALIFVQWRCLASKIAKALADSSFPVLLLHGTVAEQQRTVASFTARESNYIALILAMEDDDSGLNLTCANHVFFVHPMDVASKHVAIACERQALGRVRRRGQTKEVHLYRFITEGTVEERLARSFHEEMFGT